VSSLHKTLNDRLRRPILVIGPSLSFPEITGLNVLDKSPELKSQLSSIDFKKLSIIAAGDAISINFPEKIAEYEALLSSIINKSDGQLESLAEGYWSSVIYLRHDSIFPEKFSNSVRNRGGSLFVDNIFPSLSIGTHKPQSIPIYRLLSPAALLKGQCKLCFTTKVFHELKIQWPRLLDGIPDISYDAPMILCGFDKASRELTELFAALSSIRKFKPTKIFLPASLQNNESDELLLLTKTMAETEYYSLNAKELVTASGKSTLRSHTLPIQSLQTFLPFAEELDDSALNIFNAERVLPEDNPGRFSESTYLEAGMEALVSPEGSGWLPYVMELDCARTIASEIQDFLVKPIKDETCSVKNIRLVGQAGCGKTTTMKRLAYNLAQCQCIVYWVVGEVTYEELRLAGRYLIHNAAQYPDPRVFLFCDSPSVKQNSIHEIASAMTEFPKGSSLICSSRVSDVEISKAAEDDANPYKLFRTVEIPEKFDSDEIDNLVALLDRLNVYTSTDEARKEVFRVADQNASDVLCSLWYLVPSTRKSLTQSIENEYLRLAQTEELVQSFFETHLEKPVTRTYELAAVCSELQIGLPLEILVSAMGFSYTEWIEVAQSNDNVWGLLYEKPNHDKDSTIFFTRNHVVTSRIISILNGGAGYGGTFRRLCDLLAACDGSSEVYSAFAKSILVKNRDYIEDRLSPEQGKELFEIALHSLRRKSQRIEHHYALWVRKKCRESVAAYQILKDLLDAKFEDQEENEEHIRTSIAATIVDRVSSGNLDPDVGFVELKHQLDEVYKIAPISPHADHVFANHYIKLANLAGTDVNTAVRSLLTSIEILDLSIEKINSCNNFRPEYDRLLGLRAAALEKIVDSGLTLDEYEGILEPPLYSELSCRLKYLEALRVNKGSAYNEAIEYAELMMSNSHFTARTRFRIVEIAIHTFLDWKIHNRHGPIDWEKLLHLLSEACQNSQEELPFIYLFWEAVAEFHLQNYPQSSVIFRRLRRMNLDYKSSRVVRFQLMGKEGFPKKITYDIETTKGLLLASFPEIDYTLNRVSEKFAGTSNGQCYISFSLQGPMMTKS